MSSDEDEILLAAAKKIIAKRDKSVVEIEDKKVDVIVADKTATKSKEVVPKRHTKVSWDFSKSPLWDFIFNMDLNSSLYKKWPASMFFPGKVSKKDGKKKSYTVDELCNEVRPTEMNRFVNSVRNLLAKKELLTQYFLITFRNGKFVSVELAPTSYKETEEFAEIYYDEDGSTMKEQRIYVGGLKMLDMIYEHAKICKRTDYGCSIKASSSRLDEGKASEFALKLGPGIFRHLKKGGKKSHALTHTSGHPTIYYDDDSDDPKVVNAEEFRKALKEYGLEDCQSRVEEVINKLCGSSKGNTYAIGKMHIHHPHGIVPSNESLANVGDIEKSALVESIESPDITGTSLSYGNEKHRAHLLVYEDANGEKRIKRERSSSSSDSGSSSDSSESSDDEEEETKKEKPSEIVHNYKVLEYIPTNKLVRYGDENEMLPLYEMKTKDCTIYAIRIVDPNGHISFIPVDTD